MLAAVGAVTALGPVVFDPARALVVGSATAARVARELGQRADAAGDRAEAALMARMALAERGPEDSYEVRRAGVVTAGLANDARTARAAATRARHRAEEALTTATSAAGAGFGTSAEGYTAGAGPESR
ncbi:hypothetical protein, partial [Specibacter cremeus]|uniref:hypothetical protein n=1 Tax=Specibacter cremeus TaxID=1629051 RepID=UPI0013DE3694